MLALTTPTRFGRRDFLRVGSLGVGGLSLASLFPTAARGAAPGRPVTDKSVIFLFLHGGPSQLETFDPKMTAPAEIRSATGEVQTALPGVTFGGSFPKLAKLADRIAIVRSFTTGDANHDIKPVVGKDTFGGNIGSAYSAVAGGNYPETGMRAATGGPRPDPRPARLGKAVEGSCPGTARVRGMNIRSLQSSLRAGRMPHGRAAYSRPATSRCRTEGRGYRTH